MRLWRRGFLHDAVFERFSAEVALEIADKVMDESVSFAAMPAGDVRGDEAVRFVAQWVVG